MRRCAILECLHQEPELRLSAFFGEPEQGKHLVLQLGVVDTDAAAAQFHAVHHHVVGVGTDVAGVAVEQWYVFVFGFGEGVVHCVVALRLLVPLKHGEVYHPQRCKRVLVAQPQPVAHFQSQLVESLASGHSLACEYEQQVAWLCLATLGPCLKVVFAVEFAHAALYGAVGFHFYPH